MKTLIGFFVVTFLFLPLSGQMKNEPRAGTDDYLRAIGYSDEQLTLRLTTEERAPFLMAENAANIKDPIGDVLNRFGATTEMQVAWADIIGAALEKNEAAEVWIATFLFAAPLPERPTIGVNVLLYADADGDTENNEPNGIRGGADREFALQFTDDRQWETDFRWYNAPADFWAVNKETAMSFKVLEDSIVFKIPFSELPGDLAPRWRVAMAVSDGTYTQIDAAPGVGFPPPVGEMYPSGIIGAPTDEEFSWPLGALFALALGVLTGTIMRLQKKE